jgi:hypothetical protein
MGHEAVFRAEKLPDALFALVDQLDDHKNKNAGRHLFVSNVALPLHFPDKASNWEPGSQTRRREREARLNSHFFLVL